MWVRVPQAPAAPTRALPGTRTTSWTTFGNIARERLSRALGEDAVPANLPPGQPGVSKELDLLLGLLNAPGSLEDRAAEWIQAKEWSALETGFVPALRAVRSEEEPTPDIRIFAASCQYPNGLLDEDVAWRSYSRLAGIIGNDKGDPSKRLLLLLGDQIYADATAGLFDPRSEDDMYATPHQDLLSAGPVKEVLRRIPAAMMLDDHELRENWEPPVDGLSKEDARALRSGVRAYKSFQRRAGPALRQPMHDSTDPLWFSTSVGDVPVFVCDTRTERKVREHGRARRWRIMSRAQHVALLRWLDERNAADPCVPKVIACPALLLPRRLGAHRTVLRRKFPLRWTSGVLASDGWEGFPSSFTALLAHIADRQIGNLIFLSGDEHLFIDARIRVRRRRPKCPKWTEIRSIHASPLYAPYPFANGKPWEFADQDAFKFVAPNGHVYECEVDAAFPNGLEGGFVEVRAARMQHGWRTWAGFYGSEPPLNWKGVVGQPDVAAAPIPVAIGCEAARDLAS
jgi:hypothetical protein